MYGISFETLYFNDIMDRSTGFQLRNFFHKKKKEKDLKMLKLLFHSPKKKKKNKKISV